MKKNWHIDDDEEEWSSDGFWASYSDLMAGIVLIFVVATSLALMGITNQKPPASLGTWNELLEDLQNDKRLQESTVVEVDRNTGSLIIKDNDLQYGLEVSEIDERKKQILLEWVPYYLDLITNKLKDKKANRDKKDTTDIVIAGIEVGGHTDSTGDFKINDKLSSDRAKNILQFLRQAPEMKKYHQLLQEKAYHSGYADSRPPKGLGKRPGKEWQDARRIEIKVNMNTEEILKDVKEYLDGLGMGKINKKKAKESL